MAATKTFKTCGLLLMAVLAVLFLHSTNAQTTVRPGVTNFQLTREPVGVDSCQCSVKTPVPVVCTDYQTHNNSEKLREIRHWITNLTLEVGQLYEKATWQSELIATFQDNLAEATDKFNRMEGGQLLVTRAEIEGVRQNVRSMASALYTLQQWQGIQSDGVQIGRIRAILRDVSNISTVVDAMIELDSTQDLADLQHRITELSGQLQTCNAGQQAAGGGSWNPLPTATVRPGPNQGSSVDDKALPERWPEKAKQDSCGRLVSISEPYTVRGSLDQHGVWMRDPVVNPDYVYYHKYGASSQSVQFGGSTNVGDFQRSKTYSFDGETLQHIEEAIVYNGSLFSYSEERVETQERIYHSYYDYYNTRTTVRTDKTLSKITWDSPPDSNITIASDDVVSKRNVSSDTPLDQHGYTGPSDVPKMDLSVDESGLWVMYGSDLEMLVVSKVDEETLEFERTLESAYPKNRVGNCFIICRKVYCLISVTRYDSRVAFFMDTDSGFEGFVNVPFIIKYGSLSSIEYNPRDQLLYGWDNGHAVVYSLTFE